MKRKISAVFLISAFLVVCLFAGAADYAGDEWVLAGHYYYSDTEVYVRGHRVNSYNIGGKSAIIAADLNWHFNFYVEWNPEARATYIRDRWLPEGYADEKTGEIITYYSEDELEQIYDISQEIANLPAGYAQKADGPRGEIAGNVYYTDIKAYLNGTEIRAYNIDGHMAVLCEDFRGFGYDVVWDKENRRTTINEHRTGKPLESDMGTFYLMEIRNSSESPGFHQYWFKPVNGTVLADGNPCAEIPVIYFNASYYRMGGQSYDEEFYYVPAADYIKIKEANPEKKFELDFEFGIDYTKPLSDMYAETISDIMAVYAPNYDDIREPANFPMGDVMSAISADGGDRSRSATGILIYDGRLYVRWDFLSED